jgi:mono/diheme cytochrome c family protein
VAAAGVTLRSVSVEWPVSTRTFPGGAPADAINANCLTCHSAGMVLTQPHLARGDWQAEVDKMRLAYKAPIDPDAVPAIVAYLASLKPGATSD